MGGRFAQAASAREDIAPIDFGFSEVWGKPESFHVMALRELPAAILHKRIAPIVMRQRARSPIAQRLLVTRARLLAMHPRDRCEEPMDVVAFGADVTHRRRTVVASGRADNTYDAVE